MTYNPGDILTAWIDPRLEMRLSPIQGRGLFACAPLRRGEELVRWGGTVFTRAEVLAGKADPQTIAVLDEGLYLADPPGAPPAEDYSINHSCDPNLWMTDALTLAACRDIVPGEELTADYALWLYDSDWRLEPCCCGAVLCRGRVCAADWMLPDLQARYAGHFTPLINRRIAAAK